MRKCPFCAEEIQEEAIKCRFCGEFITPLQQSAPTKTVKWYFRSGTLLVGFLVVGPLILPLVWFHPKLSATAKMVLTVIMVGISFMLFKMISCSIGNITQYYKMIYGNF